MIFSKRRFASSLLFPIIVSSAGFQQASAEGLSSILPLPGDFTSMWWKEGFPKAVEGASYVRNIQTGYYAFGMDTHTLKITEFGPVASGTDYDSFARSYQTPESPVGSAELGLTISANGKTYACIEGGKATRYGGPRLVESGRFFQRGDVTDLLFATDGDERLNVEARLETVAWPEDLGLVLYARPGMKGIVPGEGSFGKVGGGFGFDGMNDLVVPHADGLDGANFTLGFWVFVPTNYSVMENAAPWLVCKERHEQRDGNLGIVLQGATPQAMMNIGGNGGENVFIAKSRSNVKLNEWNHVAMGYDGDLLKIFVNGQKTGETKVGKVRAGSTEPLVFGRRGDSGNERYRFRGVMDEIRMYDQALNDAQIRQIYQHPEKVLEAHGAKGNWAFNPEVAASQSAPRETWADVTMKVGLTAADGALKLAGEWSLPKGQTWSSDEWQRVSLSVKPATFTEVAATSPINLTVKDLADDSTFPVTYDEALNCHRIDITGADSILPSGVEGKSNDSLERMKVTLKNPTDASQVARLIFEKPNGRIGNGIGGVTGVSAILRDKEGNPTGIPVQLSKNWHTDPEAGVHSGSWFRAISQLRLPAGSEHELELTICYGHWGGVAAASHAQLSLIGWGSNQHWSQSALGSWGESICYEPAQGQAACAITDVRPLMVNEGKDAAKWKWTSNVGGGDFFRLFDPSGKRIAHSAMQTAYHKHGPCLSEVTFSGKVGEGIRHSYTTSLGRSDDLTKGIYHVRMDVEKEVDFSRFVIFQVGADTYNFTLEPKLAIGNESGVLKEWNATWGGDTYRTEPMICEGRAPWVSMHEAIQRNERENLGGWANRGIVIRSWKANIGGKDVLPYVAEHGVKRGPSLSSTMDFVLPPGTKKLQPGDFVEAIFEYIVMPQSSAEYYGPNELLREALAKNANSWKMIYREAVGNDRKVEVTKGKLERTYPDIRISTDQDQAEFSVSGGLGYVPITFTGLSKPSSFVVEVNGILIDQAIHGSDFWQTDYEASPQHWSQTYNIKVPVTGGAQIKISPKK